MSKRVLLVDDEIDFLDIIGEFLTEEGYSIATAARAVDALDLLKSQPFDLVLSDINMPEMKGFELVREARRIQPKIKTALITAYDVRDYLFLAKNFDIGNIITKTTPFNFNELKVLISNIATGEVFGLERYINGDIHQISIKHSRDIEKVISAILEQIPDLFRRKFRQALGEIIINAIYYGAKNERGDSKDQWNIDVELSPSEEILVCWGFDGQKAGVAIIDQKGKLTKRDVLYWLERNTTRDVNGVSRGLLDEHGKGLFITRETVDRFIINIERMQRTEVVMLNYKQGLFDGHRPLWIQEI